MTTRSIYHGVREIEQGGRSNRTTWTVGPDADGVTVNTQADTVGLNREDLDWLIRPLLAQAWEAGWNRASEELRGKAKTKANPFVDPPVGEDRDR